LQNESSQKPFTIVQQNGELLVRPSSQDPYSLEIYDVAGRRLNCNENLSGDYSVSLYNYSKQILFITLRELNNNYGQVTSKIFIE